MTPTAGTTRLETLRILSKESGLAEHCKQVVSVEGA
jgi:hypothetical protein